MNKKDLQLILKQLKFTPNKKLGQNFIVDENALNKIISISNISQNDIILEIGPGLGALTQKLVESGNKVYAIEIDYRLYSYLENIFSIYENVEIIRGDILKIDIPHHNKVISNIPYTITGPLLDKLFYRINSPTGILTIEKKIADRIFSSNDYKNFSRISISLNSFMIPVLRFNISRKSFYPIPDIMLSLIKIIPKDNINPFLSDRNTIEFFLKFVGGIMPYKNKNIVNAIDLYFKNQEDGLFNKEEILNILQKNDYENNKVFTFKIEEFIEISKLFYS
ncbi:MAG: ribosomal RNA small subunit methyltransferase A [Promethearchaeota archaeon]|nr:MAG: ribosomal RNA small subunit methyltransferase A [Candidatus Lokiarchaeota archaeon]